MAEIGKWNGHAFTVSPTLIRGFSGLSIKGSSNTDTKTYGDEQYLSRKHAKPVEISITVELSALLGCDVRTEALEFVDDATNGAKDFFYVGGKKLVTCQLMLTDAGIEEVQIAPGGTWISAKVKLALKQASMADGKLYRKKRKPPPPETYGWVDWSKLKDSPEKIKSARDTIKKIIEDAKAASQKPKK